MIATDIIRIHMHVLLKGKQCYVWIQFEMTYTCTSNSNVNDRALHIILEFISLQTPGIMIILHES